MLGAAELAARLQSAAVVELQVGDAAGVSDAAVCAELVAVVDETFARVAYPADVAAWAGRRKAAVAAGAKSAVVAGCNSVGCKLARLADGLPA